MLAAFASRGRPLGAQSLDLGEENSWIRIQNVGSTAATVDLAFYDLTGSKVASDGCPRADQCGPIEPGSGWSFFQQGYGGLPDGYRGSAFVNVDQPFVALLARDVFKGGKFQIAGDTLRLGRGTSMAYLPFVESNDQQVSRISVQNTSDNAEACVEIRYWAQGASSVTAVDPPGPTAGCPNGGELVPPRGTLLRDEHNLPVSGFDGSAVVVTYATGSGTATTGQRLAAVVDTRERNGAGLATSRGVATDELSNVVVLPMVDHNASDRGSTWSTRFRILNSKPGIANEVTLRFDGVNAAGERIEIEHTVVVTSSLTCDQRVPGGGGCLPDDRTLSESFQGTVRMQSTDPIAVVAQRMNMDGSLGDYRGFTTEEASREVVMPVLNKNYGPFGGSEGWNSSFRILTFDGSTAHVRVVYYSTEFPGGLVRDAISVDGTATVRQWEDGALPDGWVGSAIIISDQPVVAVVNLETDVFEGDRIMLYNSVSVN